MIHTLEAFLKTEEYFNTEYNGDYCIENNIIKSTDILITGHFGNSVSLRLDCENICPIPLYNSTLNIGYILQALIEFFDKEQDNSVSIFSLNNTPIRLVFDDKDALIRELRSKTDRFI